MSFVQNTLEEYSKISDSLHNKAQLIMKEFESFCDDNRYIVTSRVKSLSSLKEKIYRRDYENLYKTPEECLKNINDLIGIRIVTLLYHEEGQMWTRLSSKKQIEIIDNQQYIKISDILYLKDIEQPVNQKNLHPIYKTEGLFKFENDYHLFELQIKSLVHLLWGEIEHLLFYKNYVYSINYFFNEGVMENTYSSLLNVDKQLNFIKCSMIDQSEETKKDELLRIISKVLHEKLKDKYAKEYDIIFDYRTVVDNVIFLLAEKNDVTNSGHLINTMPKMIDLMEKLKTADIFSLKSDCYVEKSYEINQIEITIIDKMKNNKQFLQTVNIYNCLNENNDLIEISNLLNKFYNYRDSFDPIFSNINGFTQRAIFNIELFLIKNFNFIDMIRRKSTVNKFLRNTVIEIQESFDEDSDDKFKTEELEIYQKYLEKFLLINLLVIFEKNIATSDIKKLIELQQSNIVWTDKKINDSMGKIHKLHDENEIKYYTIKKIFEGGKDDE